MDTQSATPAAPALAAVDRWKQAANEAAHRYLDFYATSAGRLADAEVESARAAKLPALVPLAESYAAIRRDAAVAYVTTVRGFLDG
jgi:hypothetical protein